MKQYILLFAIISTAGIAACKKDKCQDPFLPYCENYDPCYGEHPTSADFFIYELVIYQLVCTFCNYV